MQSMRLTLYGVISFLAIGTFAPRTSPAQVTKAQQDLVRAMVQSALQRHRSELGPLSNALALDAAGLQFDGGFGWRIQARTTLTDEQQTAAKAAIKGLLKRAIARNETIPASLREELGQKVDAMTITIVPANGSRADGTDGKSQSSPAPVEYYWYGGCRGCLWGPVVIRPVEKQQSPSGDGGSSPGPKEKEAIPEPKLPTYLPHESIVIRPTPVDSFVTKLNGTVVSISNIARIAKARPSRYVSAPPSGEDQGQSLRVTLTSAPSQGYLMGKRALRDKKYKRALQFLSAAARDGDDARIWYFKGITESILGDKTAAEQSLGQAVRLHLLQSPDDVTIRKALQPVQGRFRILLEDAVLEAKKLVSRRLAGPVKPAR